MKKGFNFGLCDFDALFVISYNRFAFGFSKVLVLVIVSLKTTKAYVSEDLRCLSVHKL